MPMKRDAKGGGSESDGTLSSLYCSHCYADGKFLQPDITVDAMTALVATKLGDMGFPGFVARMFAGRTRHLKRWSASAR